MSARHHFFAGLLRGLNSAADAFAPRERLTLERMRFGLLPPSAELQEIEQIIPGGADRLRRMAEMEQEHRFEDTKRGQYLGWTLAAGAIIAAAVVGRCHGPWQVCVALVVISVLGAVQTLIRRGGDVRLV